MLALLRELGKEVTPERFQKLLFLMCQRQEDPVYRFIPGPNGPHSFQAESDKGTMIKYELLDDHRYWSLKTATDYREQIKEADRKTLAALVDQFGNDTAEQLLVYICQAYPFHALRVDLRNLSVSASVIDRVEAERPKDGAPKVLTIGYEGIKAESYMNRLLLNQVSCLVDVRKNAMSRKFGFSKSRLQRMCNVLNIRYLHVPELGIASEKRKHLNSREEFDALFREYEKQMLPKREEQLKELYHVYREHGRIALTCYERQPEECHRHKIAEYLIEHYDVTVQHL
ncbi:MAG: DUF488 domain-containing protein [Balneolaceae bacterium]|nr:DUF488 domain-containing protein [Balneolaceae bacterium]